MAALMGNSSILRSYEQLIQQYEGDFELKNNRIRDVERELQQIQFENSNLAQQLYQLKAHTVEAPASPLEGRFRDERDQLVEMMKRNYDVVVEKFELQRQRNEGLEKAAIEKERLYLEIKAENDTLANGSYKLQRANEDLTNEKRIGETKLRNTEAQLKQFVEESRVFKLAAEKQELQARVAGEQLENARRALDEISVKKQQELDMLSKELGVLTLKERDAKQKAYLLEGQLAEVRDELRVVQ